MKWIIFIIGIALLASCISPYQRHKVLLYKDTCIIPFSDYTYKTGEDIHFVVDDHKYTIPKGFETDLASIPRWYWTFLSPQYSAFVTPSIIHDYFYRCDTHKSRKFADEVLFYSLKEKGISNYTASMFYVAVRIFGFYYYHKEVCHE